jgi:ABC-2 type transport system ATP-binding protein
MKGERMSIKAAELTKVFGRYTAVDHISFEIEPGKVTGFLGPNGAGKTTTLRMILGLISPTSGEARLEGRLYRELQRPSRAVGALLDSAQFHPQRSGRNHLRVLVTAAGLDVRRVDEVLGIVELTDVAREKVGTYSLGMRQRLGIAAALLGEPEGLILDEPANGLDPSGMRWLRSFLRSFAAKGGTVFVSSHLLREVSVMADEVIVINKGKLVKQASVQELMMRASPGVRVETAQPERLHDALAAAGIETTLVSHEQLVASGSREQVGTVAAELGIPLFGLHQEERSLEDIFLELTSR